MSSQTAAAKSKDTSSVIPIHKEQNNSRNHLSDAIARRAYELFEQTGRGDGQDVSHWLQAESELIAVPQIHESSSWYTINYPLRGFSADDVTIDLDAHRAVISAEALRNDGEGDNVSSTREALYLVADWPGAVDPATASAYIRNDSLTLTVRRAENVQSASA